MQRWFLLLGCFLGTAVVAAVWMWDGQLVALPDLTSGRFDCVSYSPPSILRSVDGAPRASVSVAVMEADLRVMAHITRCIRTYSVARNMDQVVPIAARLGMKVLLGVWISREEESGNAEIRQAATMANAYPETVRAIVVGNEAMMRCDVSEARLAAYLQYARTLTHTPLTVAEIWRFWLYHPQLASSVDFITLHILPYWEDEPTSVDQSLASVEQIMMHCQERFAGKPLLIGEIGWPSLGRPHRDAVPGRIQQAQFLRTLATLAASHGWAYNVIEGFDQRWKRDSEGTVGGAWGVFTEEGVQKFPLRGPVSDCPEWRSEFLLSVALGALGWVWLFWKGAARSNLRGAVAALITPFLGGLLVMQADFMLQTTLGITDWVLGFLGLVLSVLLAGLLVRGFALGIWPTLPALGSVLDALFRSSPVIEEERIDQWQWFGLIYLVLLIGAAGVGLALALAFAHSHRDFPVAVFLLPALAFLAFGCANRFQVEPGYVPREESWLGILFLVLAFGGWMNERFLNPVAVQWAVVLVLFAIPLLGKMVVFYDRKRPTHRYSARRTT